MIVCPRCSTHLLQETGRYVCTSCKYSADCEEGIVFFEPGIMEDHDDYKAVGLDQLYRHESKHAWFRHRVKMIRKAFARYVEKEEAILEVGAGTGHTARALMDDGYRNLSVGEIHKNGLQYAKHYGLKNLYQFDLRHAPFLEHFDVVALFDVLEHIAEDGLAVRSIHSMLKPGGRVVLTVPAHRWLWSRIDELSTHHRRYTRKTLASLFEAAGFEILESRYLFTALVPGLFIRSFLSRKTTWETIEGGCGLNVSPFSNALLGFAAGAGDFLLYPLRKFVGGSLLAVARKT
jgi:2-polyprenyl-3-methyl-5-hydroxy-6-metoxy-1,4-benzoquinol methylase